MSDTKKHRHYYEYRASLDLLDLGRWVAKTIDHSKRNCDTLNKVERIISRWKWVTEVELGHLNYATLEFETSRADVAERRLAETLAKLDRLMNRYEKKISWPEG